MYLREYNMIGLQRELYLNLIQNYHTNKHNPEKTTKTYLNRFNTSFLKQDFVDASSKRVDYVGCIPYRTGLLVAI